MKCMNAFGLREGMQDEYKRRHDEIWPEMETLMLRAGLRNYTIWNVGTRLIEYYECDDPEASARLIHAEPVKARWDAYMKDILVFGERGETFPLACVFEFNSMEREA